MTREDVKTQFPDATEEQITAILNINGNDLAEAKKKNVDPKMLKKLQEDSAAYEKLKEAGLTDEEKIQKALQDAKDAEANYKRQSSRLDVEKILVAAGLAEDDYKDLIDGLVSEDAEASKTLATNLASMLAKQREAAVQKTKEELMDETKGAGGAGGAGGNDGEKTDAEKFAETMLKENASDVKGAASIIDAYK